MHIDSWHNAYRYIFRAPYMWCKKCVIFYINFIVRKTVHRISYKRIYARNTISLWRKKKYYDIHFTIIWWPLLLPHWKRNTLMMLEIQWQCWSVKELNAITWTKFAFFQLEIHLTLVYSTNSVIFVPQFLFIRIYFNSGSALSVPLFFHMFAFSLTHTNSLCIHIVCF